MILFTKKRSGYKHWTVVEFGESRGISTVPICWLNGNECSWPNGKIRKHIKNSTPPGEDWQIWPVTILLKSAVSYAVAIEYEKHKAKETETEETDPETVHIERKRKRKQPQNPDFVSDICNLSPPPQVSESFCSDDTLSITSTDLMPPPPIPTPVSPRVVTSEESEILYTQENPNEAAFDVNLQNIEIVYEDSIQNVDNTLHSKIDAILKHTINNKILLERILQNITTSTKNTEVINNFDDVPQKQFKNYSKLLEYDENLKASENAQKQLETIFYLCGGSNEKENIRRGLKRIFCDKLARKCSWFGLKNNHKIGNLKIIELLKVAVRKNFNKLSDTSFEICVAAWFRQASLRYERTRSKK